MHAQAMASRVVRHVAAVEGTRRGSQIEPTTWVTWGMLVFVRVLRWLDALCWARVRCPRCGFWMARAIAYDGHLCLLFGFRHFWPAIERCTGDRRTCDLTREAGD